MGVKGGPPRPKGMKGRVKGGKGIVLVWAMKGIALVVSSTKQGRPKDGQRACAWWKVAWWKVALARRKRHGQLVIWVGLLWPVGCSPSPANIKGTYILNMCRDGVTGLPHHNHVGRHVPTIQQPSRPNAGRVSATNLSSPQGSYLLNELRNILSAVSTAACVPAARERGAGGASVLIWVSPQVIAAANPAASCNRS